MAIKQIVEIIEEYKFCNYIQNFIQHPVFKVNSICRGSVNVDFEATDQLLIIHCAFVKFLRKNGNTMKECNGCL